MTDTWNPGQYDKFQREREQPFVDLMALVRPAPGMRVVDLGCGTGKQTVMLHAHLGAKETVGIDRSARMLEGIQGSPMPEGLRFEVGTIEAFIADPARSGACDLVFSNAAFHWVDDHETLIAGLAATLAPSGQLAFQVPAQHDAASHTVAQELARDEPFRSAFGGWRRSQPVLTPEAYARVLYRCGFEEPVVRLVVYPHVLAGPEAVVEWFKGTLLTEYEKHLPPDVFGLFVKEYQSRLLARLDASRPYFFPFKRLLCWGQRA